ncbi:hypothetical protein ACX1NX_04050 [Acinetobacter sp. ANC 5383]
MTIGDVGGIPVNLPNHIVHLVEYDGDPSWGEKRVGNIPERTYQSKFNSFYFHNSSPSSIKAELAMKCKAVTSSLHQIEIINC